MSDPAEVVSVVRSSLSKAASLPDTAGLTLFGDLQLTVPLVPLTGLIHLPDGDVRRDGGSREFITLLASDHEDYYCKGPSLIPNHPYVGINEFLSTRLARLVGLPTRAAEVITWDGHLFAGTRLLPNDRKMTGSLTPEVWARISNAPWVAYGVVTFDVWILNEDRHAGNWLGAVTGTDDRYFLVMDHDLALLGQGRDVADFRSRATRAAGPEMVRTDVLREAISSRTEMLRAIDAIQRINDATLLAEIGQLPDEWADRAVRSALFDVLRARRDTLPQLMAGAPTDFFPNLH